MLSFSWTVFVALGAMGLGGLLGGFAITVWLWPVGPSTHRERIAYWMERIATDIKAHSRRIDRIGADLRAHDRRGDGTAAALTAVDRILRANEDLQHRIAEAEAKLREQAELIAVQARDIRTDYLTRLANRQAFDEALAERAGYAERHDEVLSLILLDMDHFKRLNDRHGHAVGDRLLREAARVLQACVRETDLPARYGGEEFAVILPRAPLDRAVEVAERVRNALAHTPQFVEGRRLQLTASLGVAQWSPEEETDSLVQRCDEALFDAKAAGRNRSWWHDGERTHPFACAERLRDTEAAEGAPASEGLRDRREDGEVIGREGLLLQQVAGDGGMLEAFGEPDLLVQSGKDGSWTLELPPYASCATPQAGPEAPAQAAKPVDKPAARPGAAIGVAAGKQHDLPCELPSRFHFCREISKRLAGLDDPAGGFLLAIVEIDGYAELLAGHHAESAGALENRLAWGLKAAWKDEVPLARFGDGRFIALWLDASPQDAANCLARLREVWAECVAGGEGFSFRPQVQVGLTRARPGDHLPSIIGRAESRMVRLETEVAEREPPVPCPVPEESNA